MFCDPVMFCDHCHYCSLAETYKPHLYTYYLETMTQHGLPNADFCVVTYIQLWEPSRVVHVHLTLVVYIHTNTHCTIPTCVT